MSTVDGVGGVFVFSAEAATLAAWYEEVLGLEFEGGDAAGGAAYQVFWAVDPDDPDRRVDTTFAIMPAREGHDFRRAALGAEPESMYGDQPFMVNLRVRDLDGAVARAERHGVTVLKRQDEPYGRFAWIRDPDGNRIELYQPLPPPGEDREGDIVKEGS